MDGHTVEETHTMCMYVNMDDDLLVRFHLFLVLLVPSFSVSNWGQRTVNSFTEQKRYDRPHPCQRGVNGDSFSSFTRIVTYFFSTGNKTVTLQKKRQRSTNEENQVGERNS